VTTVAVYQIDNISETPSMSVISSWRLLDDFRKQLCCYLGISCELSPGKSR